MFSSALFCDFLFCDFLFCVTEISVELHWHLLKSLRKLFPGKKSPQSMSVKGEKTHNQEEN